MAKQFYVFLVKRPIDGQVWPCVPFESREHAEAYPHRASLVVPIELEEIEPVNVPPPRPEGHVPQCQCEPCVAHRVKS